MEYLINLLGDERFMPHGHRYLWLPGLLWTNVISDALIALAYLSISVTLIYFIHKRRDIPFDWMFAAFGVFVLACGSTHVLNIWTIWHPDYWLLAFVKAITAGASVVTAVLLIRLVPAALLIPSPQQLNQANQALREAQAEIVATTRQAGMAEVATNVLHNVGNVLNSVNVSAGLVSNQMRVSKAQALGKVVELMNEHAADLGNFLTHDEKGKMLPDYLGKLAVALAAEQRSMVEELAQLTKKIEHIKDVVATQQSYAGASRMVEPTQVRDLVEDALRMNADALQRHEVTVIKNFAEVPVLPLDRHRVLQILVNLISNAKQAMDSVTEHAHRITLCIEMVDGADGRQLRLSVADEGEGIPAENLTRIFTHGFTTRKDGHGFGLHSCVLAAQEMGGRLTAHSLGVGQGATFTLEIPINTPQDR